MGRGPGWTEAQTATLFRLLARNAKWNEIAAETGRSVASCKNKVAHPSRHPQGSVEVAEAIKLREIKRPRWTPEAEAELIRLRDVEHLTWLDIDGHFGREHGTCSAKYHKLKHAAAETTETSEPARVINPHWTEADMTLAQARWRDLFVDALGGGASHQQRHQVCEIIGAELQRTPTAVASRLRTHGASFGLHAASKPVVPRVEVVSAAMSEARARWAAQARQDPCARLMGDPPPGYSALDARRDACTGAVRDNR